MNSLKSTGLIRNAYLILCNFTVMRSWIIYTQDLSNNLLGNAFAITNAFPSFFFLTVAWAKRLTLSTFVVGTQGHLLPGLFQGWRQEVHDHPFFSSSRSQIFVCLFVFLIKIWEKLKSNWIKNKRQAPEMFSGTTSLTQLPTTMRRRKYMTRILK